MERAHLIWMLEHMRLAYYAKDEILSSPPMGKAQRFFVIKQGMVHGSRVAINTQEALLELHEGECFPIGALLAARAVTSEYRADADVFCYELDAEDFRQLVELSPVFKDFCTRRIAALFEQSTQALQAQFSQFSTEQQSFSSPLASIVQREPVTCRADTSIRAALDVMRSARLGSMIIVNDTGKPVGIFTLRDLRDRVALDGLSIDQPISQAMSRDPVSLPPTALVYEAALVMAKQGFRHILVTESDGSLRGIVSERDLFSLQRIGLRQISAAIRHAKSVDALSGLSKDIRQLTQNMMAQGVAAEQLSQLIATLNDLLSARIIELEWLAAGLQQPDACQTELCWLEMGSEGRQEQTFFTVQENGIIFNVPAGETADSVRARLLPVAQRINQALARCGFIPSSDGILAGSAAWCLSDEEWQQTFSKWTLQADEKNVSEAEIVFDFRALYGNTRMAEKLRAELNEIMGSASDFLQRMAKNALRNKPPLGMLRDFVVGSEDTLDLKQNGTLPFVDVARVLSVASGSTETNTVRRVRYLAQTLTLSKTETESWIDAFHFLQMMRLLHQYQCTAQGKEIDNRINPEKLNELDKRILKEAFRQSRKIQSRLAADFHL